MPPTALTGRLLLASPSLTDPNFQRAVVLVLNHDEDGALGVVVNRPLEVDVDAVLPGWQEFATAPGKLFQGGPVALDSALGLVAVPGDRPDPAGVRRVFGSVGLGSVGLVDLDTPPEAVVDDLAGLRIFAGYAGWGAGQLEGEIAEDAWFVLPAEARDPFSDDPGRLWGDVLRRQGGDLALVASFPADVSLN
ncbi:YqgE/AlgH family protein [Paenibacillus sp. TRM 82003]|uniref:YqgE/AlgH family protein n=1 Tax=Kineococcus sp. TRM81007 TaxID=2925831 RepID=UPI001F580A10|nr:YqgE/AlgH family protein [Kineococcus sp. TRM81007]MCI2239793.1 YqgE/AlgH family protein [Kineococcus sp. TRM81007]MCI3925904.1 YqgE/AlgH family protein [Paenibacillus sp. TRM 82003]